jgi:hypothetical protein
MSEPGPWEVGIDHPWYQRMHPVHPGDSGFLRWKKNGSGFNIARQLWDARQRALADRAAGAFPGGAWPTEHIPVLLWLPDYAHAACLGCLWLGHEGGDVDEAATEALAHAMKQPGGNQVSASRRVRVYAPNGPSDPPARKWGRPTAPPLVHGGDVND